MKLVITCLFLGTFFGRLLAQETPDTTRINMGSKQVLIINVPEDIDEPANDTIDAAPDEEERSAIEAHWAGLEFGPTMLLNSSMKSSFPNDPQWENDPGKSFSWNLNLLEHKFPIYKNYVGITTGLGFNWTQIGLKQNLLYANSDSIFVFNDTINTYAKNKLRAIYLTVPLMLEFCTKESGNEGFYLAAGVIGGLRIGSSTKQVIEDDKSKERIKTKGTYGLNAFRVDAAVKMGYKDWGVFANYNLMPLFDTDKTAAVYPLTFGLTYNF